METKKSFSAHAIPRVLLAVLIISAASVYVYKILVGAIPEQRRLGAVDLAVILVAVLIAGALLNPRLIDRLTRFKLGSVEFQLEKLNHAQQDQRNELDDLRFVLTLLLQPAELQHLKNLEDGTTRYTANHSMRTELRKLRTMGLIHNLEGTKIGDLKDNTERKLSDIVELTDRGRKYLQRLGEEKEDPRID